MYVCVRVCLAHAKLALFLLSLFGIGDLYLGSGINHYAVPSGTSGGNFSCGPLSS